MTVPTTVPLAEIPVIDVREGGPLRHAQESREGARALRDACLAFFPWPARPLLPLLDALARRWLVRSASPYTAEVCAIAAVLGFPGVWFLNGSYQWSCTSCTRDENGAPWLARTLDWPFSGLGRQVEIARMRGPAGEFFNVTWPGYAGALTACAPGRFAGCVNQAPLQRSTRHPWLRPYDLCANAVRTYAKARTCPPDQLLRKVFEEASTYAEARRMLEETPIARAVIFTLAGTKPGERCVIERTETGFLTREHETGAANDWFVRRDGWEGRVGNEEFLIRSTEEAAEKSRLRYEGLRDWSGGFAAGGFGWVAPPVLNKYTRLAVEMCAARGIVRVAGYERTPDGESALPVTRMREIAPAAAAA